MITREASFIPQTANKEDRTIEVVWSTGAPVLRSGGWGKKPYWEELDLQGADLTRFNQGAPVLNSHQSRTLTDQLGVVEKAWVEGGEGKARIRFSSRPDVEPIFKDVSDGILRNISIGYKVTKQELVERKDEECDVLKVKEFDLFELSFVPIGADSKAQTRGEQVQNNNKTNVKEVLEQERKRVAEIKMLCRKFGVDEDKFINEGMSIEKVRENVLDNLSKSDETVSRIELTRDEGETKREAITNAIEHKIDPNVELKGPARKYVQRSMVEIAREFVGNKDLSNDETISRSFNSTSDFPIILGNIANTTLRRSYESMVQKQNFRPLVRNRSVANFKPATTVRVGEMPSFHLKPEGTSVTYSTIGESGEEVKVNRYARGLSFSAESMINDSLNAFSIIKSWGVAAARLESKLFWDEFMNGKMSDGKTIFHTDHKNIAKTTGPISVETLSAARVAMARHQGIDKRDFLDITPVYLIVPVEQFTRAQQFMSQNFSPNESDKVNVFTGAYKIICDPRLPEDSWYMAASTDQIDIAEMVYLQGQRGPKTKTHVDFNSDSLFVKATMDVGCKMIDYRGVYKNGGK